MFDPFYLEPKRFGIHILQRYANQDGHGVTAKVHSIYLHVELIYATYYNYICMYLFNSLLVSKQNIIKHFSCAVPMLVDHLCYTLGFVSFTQFFIFFVLLFIDTAIVLLALRNIDSKGVRSYILSSFRDGQ